MPLDIGALIGLGGSLVSGGLNLFGQGQANSRNAEALQLAMQDYNQRMMQQERAYELATAGQIDARGNRTEYVPGVGWVTRPTPETANLLRRSDAVQNQQYVDALGRGAIERGQAFDRRQAEGAAAGPLLQAFANRYGAPTRGGVQGRNTIAGVTQAGETGDQAREAFNVAAIRSGGGGIPLRNNLNSIDKGAAGGVRTALARGEAEGPAIYEQMLQQWQGGKLDPYNMLASRASNTENIPFQPESLSGNLDTTALNRAAGAARFGAPTSGANITPIMAAMLGQRQPNYDTFAAGITANLKNLPWDEWFGSGGGGSPASMIAPRGARSIF